MQCHCHLSCPGATGSAAHCAPVNSESPQKPVPCEKELWKRLCSPVASLSRSQAGALRDLHPLGAAQIHHEPFPTCSKRSGDFTQIPHSFLGADHVCHPTAEVLKPDLPRCLALVLAASAFFQILRRWGARRGKSSVCKFHYGSCLFLNIICLYCLAILSKSAISFME